MSDTTSDQREKEGEKEDIQARGRRHTRRAQFKWFVWDKPSQSG